MNGTCREQTFLTSTLRFLHTPLEESHPRSSCSSPNHARSTEPMDSDFRFLTPRVMFVQSQLRARGAGRAGMD